MSSQAARLHFACSPSTRHSKRFCEASALLLMQWKWLRHSSCIAFRRWRADETTFSSVCEYNCGQSRVAGSIRLWPSGGDYLGGYRADLPLFRHVATGDQQYLQRRHISDGIPDSEHAESRCADDANEIERAHPGFYGTQYHGGSGELLGRGNQGNQGGVHEHPGENFRKKGIEQELNGRGRSSTPAPVLNAV